MAAPLRTWRAGQERRHPVSWLYQLPATVRSARVAVLRAWLQRLRSTDPASRAQRSSDDNAGGSYPPRAGTVCARRVHLRSRSRAVREFGRLIARRIDVVVAGAGDAD